MIGSKTKKPFAFMLSIIMTLTLIVSLFAIPADNVYAADNVYEVTGTEDGAFITGVINGTQLDGDGAMYTGIKFPAGAKSYNLTGTLSPKRDFTIETDAGADVTVDKGFIFMSSSDTLTFKGSGSFTIDGAVYGFYLNSSSQQINITSGTVCITNTSGFGVYFCVGGNTAAAINVSGGNFEVKNCCITGAEGGLEFDSGQLVISNGAQVLLEGNGATSFGDLYYNGTKPLTVTGAGTKLTINATTPTSTGYAMVLIANATMEITDQAQVEINRDNNGIRGINATGSGNTITMTGGSELTITGDNAESGIRRASVIISDDSKLDVSGFFYALDAVTLNADSRSHVTLEGNNLDDGNGTNPGTPDQATITGGSVLMQPEASVINGIIQDTSGSRVTTTPINASGEALTRFDLSSKANNSINITADFANEAGHPAYTYEVGEDHSGTAYVWAPAVKVNFWPSKEDYDAATVANIIQTNYTIRGTKITDADGTAPEAPADPEGLAFLKWINAETNEEYVPTSDNIGKDIDVYPQYGEIEVHNPTTGDESNLLLLLIVGFAAGGASIVIGRNKKNLAK